MYACMYEPSVFVVVVVFNKYVIHVRHNIVDEVELCYGLIS